MYSIYKKQINLVVLVLFLKLIVLAFLPLTGDEAYFIYWGDNLDWGYYDHPPMVGWLIYLMGFISDSHILFRVFSFFTTLVISFLIYKIAILYKYEKEKSFFVALIFLVSPIDVLITLFTNDVPLILFGTLGTYFLILALEKDTWIRYSLIAGVFLGLAFLSKYFAAFLMVSLVLFIFIQYRLKALKVFIVVTLVVFLFILENLYFNYNSCWNNIMFNFYARTQESKYNISTVIGYFVSIVYLMTPWAIYYLIKSKNAQSNKIKVLLSTILGFVFLLFLYVSLKNRVGLHWFLLFIPYMYLLYVFIDSNYYKKVFNFSFVFTLLHLIVLLTVIFIPKSYFKDSSKNKHIVLYTKPDKICNYLDKFEKGSVYSFGYDLSALLTYHCKEDIKTIFSLSKYGRQDDKLLNVKTLDKKDINIFDIRPIVDNDVQKVCGEYSVETVDIEGAPFYTVKCKNFQYEKYKKYYIEKQKELFYNIPDWLPKGKCYFKEMYYE